MVRSLLRDKDLQSIASSLALRPGVSVSLARRLLADWVNYQLDLGFKAPASLSTKEMVATFGRVSKALGPANDILQTLSPSAREVLASYITTQGPGLADPRRIAASQFLEAYVAATAVVTDASRQALDDLKEQKKGSSKRAKYVGMIADLGAIYRELTGKPPSRAVHNADSGDPGKPYGPFFEFVRSVWRLLPECADVSIDEQMKRWAKHRDRALAQSFWLIYWKVANGYGGK